MHFLSQALENDDTALFSESEALTESECDGTSDGALSDSNSSKDYPLQNEGEKKEDHCVNQTG